MDSITAPQSSVSSPAEGSADAGEFFELSARLSDPHRRGGAARGLARLAGAEDLIIFVRDAEIGVLLPAPGFRQTLPDARRWQAFLAGISSASPASGTLPYPSSGSLSAALGVGAADGSVLVLLGGKPDLTTAMMIRHILPILAAAFRGEQAAQAAEGHAAVAREAAGQSAILAASLENARHALHSALAVAESANKAKDQFLAVLSHELRTPLGPVLTTASALLSGGTLSPDLRESLEMIRRNTELEVRLIDDLLDLTRVANGKMALNLDVVDVHVVIEQTLEICRSDIYRKRLTVTPSLNATRRHVAGDATRLQQVLWNLIKNAVKFTPEAGSIEVLTANEDGRIRIDVRDSGIGIPALFLAKIFDAFEQTGEGVTRRFGGMGLGLAISKALVHAHNGQLVATSAGAGQGATFSVTLDVAPEPILRPTSKPSENAKGKARGLRLLLVEDHRDTAIVMSRLLKNLGHEVVTVGSISAALQVVEQQTFDLLLSDLGLPDGSGLDLMEQMRDRYGLAGVAISGYGMEADLARTKAAGFMAHLTKPVNFQMVQSLLSQFAARSLRE